MIIGADIKTILENVAIPYSHNNFCNCVVTTLELTKDNYKSKYTTFNSYSFEGLVHFENTDLSVGLFFDMCTFKEPLVFTNVKVSSEDLFINSDSDSIVFKNCAFKEKVLFEGKENSVLNNLRFKNCTFDKGLEISGIRIVNDSGGLFINDCTINEKFELQNIVSGDSFSLENNRINGFTNIAHCSCSEFLLDSNEFSTALVIEMCNFLRSIEFQNNFSKKEVELRQNETAHFFISGSTFERGVTVNYELNEKFIKGISRFYIDSSKFINGIYINGTGVDLNVKAFNERYSTIPIIDYIQLNLSSELIGNIEFSNLDVGILDIEGRNDTSNIYLKRLSINTLNINGLINNSGLIFSEIRASNSPWYVDDEQIIKRETTLNINDSNFGNAQFFNTDFSVFKKIYFHNNILINISTSLVKWFTPDQLPDVNEAIGLDLERKKRGQRGYYAKEEDGNWYMSFISYLKSKKEIYRQLKISSRQQGDIAASLEFQRWEMDYYRKIVKHTKPREWNEYIILTLSRTNDFGQNWLKALRLFILWTFIFYLPIGYFNSPFLDYSIFAHSFHDVWLNIKVILWYNLKFWFVLMNPTHSLKDIFGESTTFGWLYFWDMITRIVVSYFIFQIISGFRKFLNK